ncbi:hypothetical protein JCM19037_1629 [Geomicrobium sp. JCM 19037]|uniref:hypothetical protein n=1 Tax=Geomicrobium sp. JCM 19037 TaxID=1460634 RepID=UPI00045F3FDF|nr:hypothetical protein [Geomicrobium sp. JCM 19037]GAK03314.1 hypothetical protein JCM19037_1629 [Geomicrobium sp. JCM 19037]
MYTAVIITVVIAVVLFTLMTISLLDLALGHRICDFIKLRPFLARNIYRNIRGRRGKYRARVVDDDVLLYRRLRKVDRTWLSMYGDNEEAVVRAIKRLVMRYEDEEERKEAEKLAAEPQRKNFGNVYEEEIDLDAEDESFNVGLVRKDFRDLFERVR